MILYIKPNQINNVSDNRSEISRTQKIQFVDYAAVFAYYVFESVYVRVLGEVYVEAVVDYV